MSQIEKSDSVTFEYLKSLLDKELIYSEPSYYCTIRGLGRLLQISSAALTDKRLIKSTGKPQGVLSRLATCKGEELPESLKPAAGFDFRSMSNNVDTNTNTAWLPDTVIACVIKYYAYDARTCLTRAKQLDLLMTSIGVRAFFQQIVESEPSLDVPAPLVKPAHAQPIPSLPVCVDDIFINETPVEKVLRMFQKLESARLTATHINNFIRSNLLVEDDDGVNTSYRGVQKHKNRFRAHISVNGVNRIIGSYETPEEAAQAYDAYAKVIHGDKARLNF